MYTISKEFHFSASHVLMGLPEGHQCGRLHGHNYVIEVVLQSDVLDETGFVLDYGMLTPAKELIDNEMDHRHLNDVFPGMQTSAENIAKAVYDRLAPYILELHSISVRETPKTVATYVPN